MSSSPAAPAPAPAMPLRGVALSDPPPPALLRTTPPPSGARGLDAPNASAPGSPADALLATSFVRVERAFDLTATAREATASVSPLDGLPDEQVVVLELVEEGGTTITTAGALRSRQELWQVAATLGNQRGLAPARLFSRLYSLAFSDDSVQREVEERLRSLARERLGEAVEEVIDISASRVATTVLLKVIEARLPSPPGLHRWRGGAIGTEPPLQAEDPGLAADAERGLLVFVHGTGSSTSGSFGELASPTAGVWPLLTSVFGERMFGFEQHTFSVSPIDNALALARSLPRGARLHLVSHGSGGLVVDLLCAARLDDDLIDAYHHPPAKEERLTRQRELAAAEQRERLRELRTVLADKAFRVERCVRVASPARGTRLLGENLDIFLSVLLSLISSLPLLAGQPVVAVLKRLVLDVVRRRLDPCLVPGLATLAPDAPLATLLARLPARTDLAMATIAGQREGGHPLERLALLFSDSVFFQRSPNDLVVDTDAMQAGLAPQAGARAFLERGVGVSHVHYFSRPACARALARWLTERDPRALDDFHPLTGGAAERERTSTRDTEAREDAARTRAAGDARARPVVVVVPDLLGSQLWDQTRQERLWLAPGAGLAERLRRLRDPGDLAIAPEKLMEVVYGDLCRALQGSHRVVRFANDWRHPLEAQAERLGAVLRPLVAEATDERPLRLLAHGLGGLVVRGLIVREPDLWQRLIALNGARLVMLGTPHRGSHQLVELLLGKAPWIRSLARASQGLEMKELLALLAGWPGVLQGLPAPGEAARSGPADAGDVLGAGGLGEGLSWFDAELWRRLREHNSDRWFGDPLGALPHADTLARGRWLWDQTAAATALPGEPDRLIQVVGQAPRTPCGVALRQGRLVMLNTAAGDGVVTREASRLEGLGHTYQATVDHGGLASRPELFPALVELLVEGRTDALQPLPASRGAREGEPPPRPWQPGPTPVPSDDELLRGLAGAAPPAPSPSGVAPPLRVSCQAMDLRYVDHPLMVGHYDNDSIAAAEALLDRDIVAGELSSRRRLGLYAGPRGTSTVVLMPPSARERGQGSCRGAVVIGLGTFGDLSTMALTEAVRVGALRYLLQHLDRGDGGRGAGREVGLASLLIGQNSSGDIAIEDSVAALVQGVLTANEQFAETFPDVSLRVGHLQLVELFLDTAISATRVLRRLEKHWNRDGQRVLAVEGELRFGKGWRHRLDAAQESGYWPRLMVTTGELSGDTPDDSGTGVSLANTLSFAFLGQRARAETQRQRRQNGLVEALVAASIHNPTMNPDLCRTLFQLLVPSSFKDLARQLDQLVLVLDATTANLPWELLMADDKPLALQLAVVRQLQAPRYRQRLRQTTNRAACVIGNPSSEGFTSVFAGETGTGGTGLASLEGAGEEAERVLRLLRQRDYFCEESLQEENAVDVITKLYRHPYRLLHIAGHGVFNQPTHEGERRSGVVLAGGRLITAAEIEAMEVVPELVFLNCCHLGTVKRESVAFNQLAASVSGQLIEMGVRAVVACGWAVDDAAALTFAEVFYTAMLQGVPFGRAVFRAREAAHATQPTSTTWGAYQAYGDPDYRLEELVSGGDPEPPPADATAGGASPTWVTPLELIDQLQQLEGRIRHGTRLTAGRPPLLTELESLLSTAPASWLGKAEVALAVADVHAALGGEQREEACRHYLSALRCHQPSDGLPIRAIEQLANLEARLGEQADDEPRVEGAIARLRALLRLADGGTAPTAAPPEWQGLLGSACKRLAALRARALVAAGRTGKEALPSVMTPLEEAIAAYGQASGDLHCQLNQLALESVRDLPAPPDPRAIRRARALLAEQRRTRPAERSFWSAAAFADALLALRLVDRRLAATDAAGEKAAREVLEAYQEVFVRGRGTPLERESVLEQLALLADLVAVRGRGRADPCPAAAPLAERLRAIGAALRAEGTAPSSPAEAEGSALEEEMEVL
ncbi:MAG: CHAT domain-containing protein [Cyanobacteriota bacterium]|nr:CHAT domain-containing protein [Cyanobacteriota bacterium]